MKDLGLHKTVLRHARVALVMLSALIPWTFQANAAWYLHGDCPSLNGDNEQGQWHLDKGWGMIQDGSSPFFKAYMITFPGGENTYYFFSSSNSTNWDADINPNRWGPSIDHPDYQVNKGE